MANWENDILLIRIGCCRLHWFKIVFRWDAAPDCAILQQEVVYFCFEWDRNTGVLPIDNTPGG